MTNTSVSLNFSKFRYFILLSVYMNHTAGTLEVTKLQVILQYCVQHTQLEMHDILDYKR